MKKLLFIICITCVPHFTFANTDPIYDRMEQLKETGIENAKIYKPKFDITYH